MANGGDVGIIANPAAGKDIRRLVAHASVFDNHEKVNILRRVLLGLDAVGVEHVLLMPDFFGIGPKALDGLKLSLRAEPLAMRAAFDESDSARAAAEMRAAGVRCLITLGGDGTNRAAAKGSGDVPIVPISTGTNNVFPVMIEGTLAGLAAGVVARGIVKLAETVQPTARLEILRDGKVVDIALIDVVVYEGQFIGSRAIWNPEGLRQIVLTRAEPYNIGLSAIGGYLDGWNLAADEGLAIEAGGDIQVLAPIAPGLIRRVGIKSYRRLKVGEQVPIEGAPVVIALDGERTLAIHKREAVSARLSPDGPRVVDIRAALKQAAAQGFFIRTGYMEGGDADRPRHDVIPDV